MKTDRKEQRPDSMTDGKMECIADFPLDDPNYHYRIVSKWSAPEGRVGKHKTKGYKVVAEDDVNYVMACDKDKYEARQAASMAKSENRLKGQRSDSAEMSGVRVSTEHDTVKFERGDE